MEPDAVRRRSPPRVLGLGLVLVLAGTACGLHQEQRADYGHGVGKVPRSVRGAGGSAEHIGALRQAPREQPVEKRNTTALRISPEPLPRAPQELGFLWPVGGSERVTSAFGWRTDPISERHSFHHGLDIGCWRGQAIAASKGGKVLWAGRARVYGNAVVVLHRHGLMTVYGHMREVAVTPGARVARGATIGTCGSTGRSTGPHLHLEVRHGSAVYDPLSFLP